jgi:hypothetical protein
MTGGIRDAAPYGSRQDRQGKEKIGEDGVHGLDFLIAIELQVGV